MDSCYASANIKALETLGYAEHICNYVVILDSWFYGKKSVIGTLSNSGLILEDITSLDEMQIISMYLEFALNYDCLLLDSVTNCMLSDNLY
jgi:hypothetical protein